MQKLIFLLILLFLSLSLKSQRIIQNINSSWRFTLDKQSKVTTIVNIPHTWNNKDAFTDGIKYYRGVGSYEKEIFIPYEWEKKRLFLKFEGVNQICKVWVNGYQVSEHRGGYTGFVFDITDHLKLGKENRFKIECDNKHHPDIPPLEADFNFYGGIYRDVYLVVTEPIHFEMANEPVGKLLIRTPEVNNAIAKIKVEGKLVNHSKQVKNCNLFLKIKNPDGKLETTSNKKIKLGTGQKQTYKFDYQIENPILWSPENPGLYSIEVTLVDPDSGNELDKLTDKFGCRWFKMDPEKGFFLNGKHYKLIGVNRHQDYEGLGNALPNSLHQNDYRMIKKMGVNFVRIAHYPHDPEAYRLCDELGLLVWSEIPVINEVNDSEAFLDNCVKMQREQIFQFFNHPSIVMWGYMNEIFIRMVFNRKLNNEEKKAIITTTFNVAKSLNEETKALDPDRLTVMALHNNQIYNTTGIADIPDVVGWNLYFG